MVPLPVSESRLCKFVSFLADQKLKHRTIKTYLLGVRYFQIRSGWRDPFHNSHMPHLEYTMKGIKRVESQIATTASPDYPENFEANERGVVGVGIPTRYQANMGRMLSGVLWFSTGRGDDHP